MITLHDLFIGDFPITQYFGEHAVDYSVYGYPGHNGIDIGCPTGTILLNPFPQGSQVTVLEVGEETGGYGRYIRLWDHTQKAVIIYAHCREVTVKKDDILYFQQLVAYSNSTGNSTAPHLHCGLLLVDENGYRLNKDAPYKGYLNPLDKDLVQWVLLNPTEPGIVAPLRQTVEIDKEEYLKLVEERNTFEKDKNTAVSEVDRLNEVVKTLEKDRDDALSVRDRLREKYDALEKEKTTQSLKQTIEDLRAETIPPNLPTMYKEISDKYFAEGVKNDALTKEKANLIKMVELLTRKLSAYEQDQPVSYDGENVIVRIPRVIISKIITGIHTYLKLPHGWK